MSDLSLVQDFCLGDVSIQGLTLNGEPVFAAFEVAKMLGYENPHEAVSDHCEETFLLKYKQIETSDMLEMNKIKGLTLEKGITLIYEADVYALILRSNLESAKKFQRWICKEVLPSLRKIGSYSINQNILEQQTKLQIENEKLKEERNELIARLHKSTHNRISCVETDENGVTRLTQKDRRLVDMQTMLKGKYFMQATALSATIHKCKAFQVEIPEKITLKDGRVFCSIYKEPAVDEKLTSQDIFELFLAECDKTIFDY